MAENLISGQPMHVKRYGVHKRQTRKAQKATLKGMKGKNRRQTYPGHKGVGSLGSIGSHDGIQVLMQQGPYEHYAVPIT